MAYIRTCVQNLEEIRRPARNNCPSSLIIDIYLHCVCVVSVECKVHYGNRKITPV